jgi:hypothetical protein
MKTTHLQQGLLLAALAALTGCAQVGGTMAELGRPVAQNVTFTDSSWARAQKHANVQALVLHDETYANFRMHQLHVAAGVGPQEKAYRRVVLFMVHSEGGRPLGNYKGFMRFIAVVPDGMPKLKTGDLVEARMGPVYDYLKGFADSGEGTAVLRILCPNNARRADQDRFRQCASVLPWHQAWGEDKRYYDGILASPSARPYAPSLRYHAELAFTPYYDTHGNPLGGAVAPAPRPDITTWPAPTGY